MSAFFKVAALTVVVLCSFACSSDKLLLEENGQYVRLASGSNFNFFYIEKFSDSENSFSYELKPGHKSQSIIYLKKPNASYSLRKGWITEISSGIPALEASASYVLICADGDQAPREVPVVIDSAGFIRAR